jgi:hypothetical protein
MKICALFLRWRAAERVGVRALAREIGISYSTLSRIENGEEPSGKTLAAPGKSCHPLFEGAHKNRRSPGRPGGGLFHGV